MSRGRCFQQLDGIIRDQPNLPRAVNGALLWAEEEKSLPFNDLSLPHFMVAPDWFTPAPGSSRYWDTTKGPLKIVIKVFVAQPTTHSPEVQDTACQNEIIIAGHGAYNDGQTMWNLSVREKLVNGAFEYSLEAAKLPGTGRGTIYVFKDGVEQQKESPGNMGDFCWGPGPGTYTPPA